MSGSDEELPDELPLSQDSLLPSQLDLGSANSACGDESELPSELPVEESADADISGDHVEAPAAAGTQDLALWVQAEVPEAGLPSVPPSGQDAGNAGVSLFRRRGRKDRILLAALAEAHESLVATDEAASNEAMVAVGNDVVPHRPSASELARGLVRRTVLESIVSKSITADVVGGYKLQAPLQQALCCAVEVSQSPDVPKDPEVQRLGAHFLREQQMALSSKRLLCDMLNVDDRKLDRVMPRLAAAVHHLDMARRRSLELAITDAVPKEALTMFLEFAAYDETPLVVQMRGEELGLVVRRQRGAVGASGGGEVAVAVDDNRMASFKHTPELKLATNSAVQKVLQHQQAAGILMKVEGRSVMLLLPLLSNLVVVESGTGVVLQACQLGLSACTRATKLFSQRVRAVCTDGSSANIACEKGVAAARGAGSRTLHALCDVHRTSLVHNKLFTLLDDNVRGMVRCALSMRAGSAMGKFRRCLREEVEARLEVLHGRPSAEAEAYKQGMLGLFVSTGPHAALKRVLLAVCPNGDWRAPRVQYFVPATPGATEDKAAIREHLVAGVLTALCASRPEVYPRSRWTGCDVATDDLGIIEACHGLLSGTYRRFIASFGSGGGQARPSPTTPPQSDVAHAPLALEDVAQAMPVLQAGEEPEAPSAATLLGPDRQADPGAELDWAAANAAFRRDAAEWLQSKPFGKIVLQRLLMEPLRRLLSSQFKVASAQWDKEQQCIVAQALERGEVAQHSSRQYRLAIAASGHNEEAVRRHVQDLWLSGEKWALLPLESHHVGFRSLAFRSCSRLLCAVHQLLVVPHRKFPVRLFALLEDASLAGSMLNTPECLLDPFSLDMKKRHPSWEGEEFMQRLVLCGLLMWKDTSSIEAKHASIRRLLTAASVQTHTQNFQELAAQWLFLQCRNRMDSAAPWQAAKRRQAARRSAQKAGRAAATHKASLCIDPTLCHPIYPAISWLATGIASSLVPAPESMCIPKVLWAWHLRRMGWTSLFRSNVCAGRLAHMPSCEGNCCGGGMRAAR